MLPAGDFEQFRVILDYYTNMALLLGPRTQTCVPLSRLIPRRVRASCCVEFAPRAASCL